MSDYKIVNVAEQDVCFDDDPKRKFAPMSLVLAVLNHWSEDPESILEDGGIPKKYTVRLTVEIKEKEK